MVYNNNFHGAKVSEYGIENNRVDYLALKNALGGAVLCNEIIEKYPYMEIESGYPDHNNEIEELQTKIDNLQVLISDLEDQITEDSSDEDDEKVADEIHELNEQISDLEDQISELEDEELGEIYQYFIVSDWGAELLEQINEIVFYCKELDIYVWGIKHCGTAWDYVLTSIKLDDNAA